MSKEEVLELSIVIPAFNEAGNLIPLIEKIEKSCRSYSYEIIAVDDSSTDGTLAELKKTAQQKPHLKILPLKRRSGQTAAIAAGVDHAKGRVIVPIDGDGQNDPSDIPRLIEKIEEGYDVVSGWRKNRKDAFLVRRLPSMIANFIISYVTGVWLHDYGCTLKAYKRSMIAHLQLYGEMHRFLPAWASWQGGEIAEIPVNHFARVKGRSKYGLSRTFKVFIDLLTLKFFSGYLYKPNYIFSGLGIVVVIMGFVSGALALFDKWGPDAYPKLRIPLLLLSIFFGLVSVFMFLMGLLAELLVRLYFEIRNEKPYRLADE